MTLGSLLDGTPNIDKCRTTVKEKLDWFGSSDQAVDWYVCIEDQLNEYIKARIQAAAKGLDEFSVDTAAQIQSRIYVSSSILSDAIYRSFRRALYCKCFNGLDLNEMKTAGLFAYWIVKLHPITFIDYISATNNLKSPFGTALDDINEQFAVHFILSIFFEKHNDLKPNYVEYRRKLIHALRYRCHSENSMMLVSESLGFEAF
jgi:hypothetical protein